MGEAKLGQIQNESTSNACFTMRPHLRQNATNVSEIYIGCPIYISDVRYLYPTSDIPALALAIAESGIVYRTSDIDIGHPIYISDVRYRYRTSDIGTRMSDIGTRMSDIDIRRRIYILDVQYRFRKHWWHFVLNGASYFTQNFSHNLLCS